MHSLNTTIFKSIAPIFKYLGNYFRVDYSVIRMFIKPLAWMVFIGHLGFHVIDKYFYGMTDSLLFRLVVSVPALLWLTFDTERSLNRGQRWYFEIVLMASLPVLFQVMVILNHFNNYWLASQFFAAILFGILIKPIKQLILWPLAFLIAIGIIHVFYYQLPHSVLVEAAQINVGAFALMLIAGVFQSVFIENYIRKVQLNELVFSQALNIKKQNDKLTETLDTLKNTQSQLLHSEKMVSLGMLTAGIAHELKNPLNFIQGGVNCINVHLRKNPEHKEELLTYINMITKGVDRSIKILNGLNRFNHRSANYNEDCDICKTLEDCLIILGNMLKSEQVRVTKYFHSGNIIIKGNEGELHQVFLNIIHNAIQACSKGGHIQITTYVCNKQLLLLFKDDGQGILAENLKNVTVPFFTTKPPGQGTGLGLSIAYSIVKRHNGEISFESELEKGTKVALKLPIV